MSRGFGNWFEDFMSGSFDHYNEHMMKIDRDIELAKTTSDVEILKSLCNGIGFDGWGVKVKNIINNPYANTEILNILKSKLISFGYRQFTEEYIKYIDEKLELWKEKDKDWDCNKNRITGEFFDNNGYDIRGFDKEGYDKEGYDKDGYDCKGFNREGINKETRDYYDKEGYDKEGYNREGYNREGYNCKGFNREGINKETGDYYDKDGYDKEGYDREGYDKEGYDREGYDREGYDKGGYDREGYDYRGFDADGINKKTKNMYDENGYDAEGYYYIGASTDISSMNISREDVIKKIIEDASKEEEGFIGLACEIVNNQTSTRDNLQEKVNSVIYMLNNALSMVNTKEEKETVMATIGFLERTVIHIGSFYDADDIYHINYHNHNDYLSGFVSDDNMKENCIKKCKEVIENKGELVIDGCDLDCDDYPYYARFSISGIGSDKINISEKNMYSDIDECEHDISEIKETVEDRKTEDINQVINEISKETQVKSQENNIEK